MEEKGRRTQADLTAEEQGSKRRKVVGAGIRAATKAKESRWPPDAGKGKKMDFPLEPPGRNVALQKP